jgi:hypothetical protein
MNARNQAAVDRAIAKLILIRARIAEFDRGCKDAEHTDTGEAWNVLTLTSADAQAALKQLRSIEP